MSKKKINRAQQQKLLSAQHKKAFMQKLRKYCAMMGDDSLFNLLPEDIRNVIYGNRGTSFKIRVAEGAKITKRFVKILYAHINEQLKSTTMVFLPDSNQEVSLFDYFLVVWPLEAMLLSESERAYFSGCERFDELRDAAIDNYEEYLQGAVNIIHRACYAFCDLSKHYLYTFTYNVKENLSDRNSDCRKHQMVTIGVLPLDVRHVKINGERRTVCQVGEIKHKDNTSSLLPAEAPLQRLGIPGAAPDEKVPVYIQQHAVDRIMTRAYCPFPGTVESLVYKAFSHHRKIIPAGKDRYLIECFYSDVKIGYFLAVYTDGILVIRTFLLITHSNTPEGRKLERLTGLQKSDKTYLAIDDLRSLANSDIIDDPAVEKIFIEAGCESIIELCRRVRLGYEYGWLWDKTTQSRELSKLILEYIRLGADDEEYFVNDDD
ncbi:MAG: hypothetical protein LBL24_04480 [Bacteroidales bacterium]|jgi:hypothetical protein|nr:hypothetical protein [Bacteroidales bacterium]